MATRLFGTVKAGVTSVSLDALLLKTADGTADTGKVASNLTAYYYRQGASATVSVTLFDLAALNTSWTSGGGGVKEIADGIYRVDWPNAAFASGADWVELTIKDGTTALYKERIALESDGCSDIAAMIGTAGAGLTSLGDTRLAYLDAAVSSRSTFAGGAVASVTGSVGGNVVGSVASVGNAGYTLWQNSYSGGLYGCGSVRFAAQCSQIDLWAYLGNVISGTYSTYRLFVDGVGQSPVTAGPVGSLSYGKVTLATGLDATATHDYEIVVDDPNSYHQLYEILLTGGTGFGTRPAARNVFAAMGDSITAGAQTTASQGYVSTVARALGLDCANAGVSSSTVTTTGTAPMVNRTGGLTQFGNSVTKMVVCGGINDVILGATSGAYQTAYLSMITALASGCPNADIYCLGILPNAFASVSQPTVDTFRAASQAAVTSLGNAKVHYVDTTGWATTLAPGGDYTINFAADKLHPNAAGHALLAGLVQTAIS